MKKSRLEEIEKRLIELEEELKPYLFLGIDYLRPLEIEKAQLEKERQFILDKRGSWKYKIIWDLCVPIVVSLFVTIVTVYFIR